MSEKCIAFRLNLDKYSHKKAYEIYQSIPNSQKSDYMRMTIILMNDRNELINYISNMISSDNTTVVNNPINNDMEVSDEMLDYLIEFTVRIV